jgi:CubicO group peptidase (beta-lactamase class C family)
MNKNIRTFLDTCITDKIFPGCTLGIIRKGSQDIIAAGRLTYDPDSPRVINDTVYDVASITKAIPTGCLALQLIEQGALSLSSRLADRVPECCGRYHDRIRLEHLLTHTLEFRFRLSDMKSLPPETVLKAICSSDLKSPPGDVYCYANATSILLGLMIERVSGTPLDILAQTRFFDPLAMTSTTFFPGTLDRALIAPSETDPWRGREIRGEVHDESAWALRPVLIAGSAGLFSTTPDLLRFMTMILNGGESGGTRYFARDTIAIMHTNTTRASSGTPVALGWELDQERFMGAHRTATTFGKTGFTGCTIVAEPQEKTGFVFLTNHTWPQRRKDKEEINRVRRGLADLIFNRQGRPQGR